MFALRRLAFLALLAAIAAGPAQRAVAASPPTIAVIGFDTSGIVDSPDTNIDPGLALSDLLTDQLVNRGGLVVVDRTHIQSILQEKDLAESGDISPDSAIEVGKLIGAKYLITGRITQFALTSRNGGVVGGTISSALGGSGVRGDKVTLKVSIHVIETVTGRIVQAFTQEDAKTGTSFVIVGFSGRTVGAYESEQFQSSIMGKLMDQSAQNIGNKLDIAKITGGAQRASISGKVLALSDNDIILNVGANNGVESGMYFDVFKVTTYKDPDSGRMLSSRVKKGKIQIVSVDRETSVARKVSGNVGLKASVQSE